MVTCTIPKASVGRPCVVEAIETKTAVMAARTLVIPTNHTIPIRLLICLED